MSKDELKKLESQIVGLSKQLKATQKSVIGVSSHMAKWIEKKREETEKTEIKHEILLYYRSLAMGLILGIFGNMFVSYLMKALEIFQISSEGWLLTTFVALVGVLALIWVFNRDIKKLSKEIPTS